VSSENGSPAAAGTTAGIGELLTDCELVQLGQPLAIGAPRFPSHPPFMYSLTAHHGDGFGIPGQDPRISGASDMFAMGCHTGTHMDSLNHCSLDGCLYDGTNVLADGIQIDARGIETSGDPIRPLLAPGVLLDFPAMLGVDQVDDTYDVTPELIDECAAWAGVEIPRGGVVLIRTGWDSLWGNPARYLSRELPGPTPAAAEHLVEHGVIAAGSDTVPFERAPGDEPLRVHAILLVQAGVFIFECLNLVELSRRRAYEFVFSVNPLRIAGATGSPVNPVAIVSAG
jgi:kynurenine formamidase